MDGSGTTRREAGDGDGDVDAQVTEERKLGSLEVAERVLARVGNVQETVEHVLC